MNKKVNPPRYAQQLLETCCVRWSVPEIAGDLEELFRDRVKRKNTRLARWHYWKDVFTTLPAAWLVYRRRKKHKPKENNSWDMIIHNLLAGFRHALKRPVYSFINITGLALGISACLIIFSFVYFHLHFDGFHQHADTIASIQYSYTNNTYSNQSPAAPHFLGPKIAREFPEVETQCRLLPSFSPSPVRFEDKNFEEAGIAWADSTFLHLFSFTLLKGGANDFLRRPNTVVITQRIAEKYFGSSDPVGKSLVIGPSQSYEVTGVLANVPSHSHIQFDLLISLATLKLGEEERWDSPNYITYILLKQPYLLSNLEQKLNSKLLPRERDPEKGYISLSLQPLRDMHFNIQAGNYLGFLQIIDPKYLTLFSGIGILILLIACVNYVNLTTARAAERGREVGVRKVAGASIRQLFWQFITDSAVHIVPAFVVAILITLVLRQIIFQSLGLPSLELLFENYALVIAGLSGAFIIITVLAGLYPALILSRFQPSKVFKGKFHFSPTAVRMRKGLVMAQFCISIVLMICALVISSQLKYMQEATLGYDKEQIIVLPTDKIVREKFTALQNELKQLAFVSHAFLVSSTPTDLVIGNGAIVSEVTEELVTVGALRTDADFLEAMNIPLLEGRNFKRTREGDTDSLPHFIVNETFVTKFQLNPTDIIGEKIWVGVAGGVGEIVGIMKDFHTGSLHHKIEPVVLYDKNGWLSKLMIRLEPGQLPNQLSALEKVWKKEVPHRPFSYAFLDENYNQLYRTEQRVARFMQIFSAFAIVIACLGILGLASYAAVQRTKEISVRKVMGASQTNIIVLLLKEYMVLVVVSFLISIPLAYYFAQDWLQIFEYRIPLGVHYFAIGGLLAVGFALVTISYQAIKASQLNPASTLKSE